MPIAIKNSKIDISSEEITKELAKDFSNYLKGGEVIFLYGEMGVGKTTFVKHLINQLQIEKKLPTTEVTSPTFNLLNEYELDDLVIKHYDLFRLKDESEVKNLDLFDKLFFFLNLVFQYNFYYNFVSIV
jgi:tRNA threonylcarbamoyladenosine biosynthesis protein TsaE